MNLLKTCSAVLLGFLLGVAIYHPRPVKANSSLKVHVMTVHAGDSMISGHTVVGFSCTANETCRVLTVDEAK